MKIIVELLHGLGDTAVSYTHLDVYMRQAQSVEHSAVNRVVVGSSPTRGASKFSLLFKQAFYFVI